MKNLTRELSLPRMKSIIADSDTYYYGVSFDIDDFVGDGIYYLQVYDANKQLLSDRPFAQSNAYLRHTTIRSHVLNEIRFKKRRLK